MSTTNSTIKFVGITPSQIRRNEVAANKALVDGLYKLQSFILETARQRAVDPDFEVPPLLAQMAMRFSRTLTIEDPLPGGRFGDGDYE